MNADEIVYIGDNPTKDFMAPTQLGMKHIYYKNPDTVQEGFAIERKVTIRKVNPEV